MEIQILLSIKINHINYYILNTFYIVTKFVLGRNVDMTLFELIIDKIHGKRNGELASQMEGLVKIYFKWTEVKEAFGNLELKNQFWQIFFFS